MFKVSNILSIKSKSYYVFKNLAHKIVIISFDYFNYPELTKLQKKITPSI